MNKMTIISLIRTPEFSALSWLPVLIVNIIFNAIN